MRMPEPDARRLLLAADHGVLSTLHPRRGVDAVPVVYVADQEGFVGIPVDRVKPKASGLLQRERNLLADPRATLLVEYWDRADWSGLWWVRAELHWEGTAEGDRAARMRWMLADRFEQYREQPFERVLVLRTITVTGWAARPVTTTDGSLPKAGPSSDS